MIDSMPPSPIDMQPLLTKDTLFAALTHGATIITPNNRLCHQLLEDYFAHTHTSVNPKPRCLPYQAFLQERYKKARHLYANQVHPLLLTTTQQRHLWQQILSSHPSYAYHEGLQQEIQEAWTHCLQWNIDHQHPSFQQTPQTLQFQRWWLQFEKKLTELQALTEAQLEKYLLSYPDLFTSTPAVWACFDDFTPQQRLLQQGMREQGAQQYGYDLEDKPTTTLLFAAKDGEEEFLQMIAWVQQKIAAQESRIAIVIPDLDTQSHRIQRLLQRHIPSHQFNISLGQSLSDFPIAAHALVWLNLDPLNFTHHQACLLLHSPYLAGSKSEFIARADMMQDNRILQEPTLSFTALIASLKRTTPILADLLHTLSPYPLDASITEWVHLFKSRLTHLGFPGEYPLDSKTYQCFQRFVLLLDEYLQLSVITPILKKEDALNALNTLAKSTIFQSKTSKTPLQLLGLLEASGCTFDSIWVSGLTDQCLPQKSRLSAFIPLELQRSLAMPHALPERELQFAEQSLKRLQNGSQNSVFSYPRLTGDTPNLPSPLVDHLPPFIAQDNASTTHTLSKLLEHNENYQLPLMPTESISGGTTLLANQAKCPFRAFAMHRLYAIRAPSLSDGPDASERGQIMHKIMELLWRALESQQQLLSLSEVALNQQIDAIIRDAINPLIQENSPSFSSLIQDVEIARLKRLVSACLAWEKQRPPFVVEALEQEFIIPLVGIDFRVRIDRLDKTSTDTKCVIDYKSSLPPNKPWNEERPDAPQLLLYALLDNQINTLLFIQLKSGQVLCSGISDDTIRLEGISCLKKDEVWTEKQQQWRQQLTQLAQEIREGHCPPIPTKESTCQRCDFLHLCRKE